MIEMNFKNQTHYKTQSYKKDFLEIAEYTLSLFKIKKDVELSVNIVSRNTIQEINKTYRNLDRVTDVISFEFDDGFNEYDGYIVLGDIFICHSRANQQAKQYGHSIRREMCFLFTHGLLHLLGYDHMEENDEKEMFSLQEMILKNLDINR